MIPKRIAKINDFVDFLIEKRNDFSKIDDLISQRYSLIEEGRKYNPDSYYIDRMKFKNIQNKIMVYDEQIDESTIDVIKDKINELNLYNMNNPTQLLNEIYQAGVDMFRDFEYTDLPFYRNLIVNYDIMAVFFIEKSYANFFIDRFIQGFDCEIKPKINHILLYYSSHPSSPTSESLL